MKLSVETFLSRILTRKPTTNISRAWAPTERQLLDNVNLRRCSTCNGIYEKEAFPVATGSIWGRHSRCSECDRKHKRWWRQTEREKFRVMKHRYRARKRNAEGSFTAAEWAALLDQYGHRCLACGITGVRLSPDHVVPLSRGGRNDIGNIQPLCLGCNVSKGAKTIDYRPLHATQS